MKTVMENVKVMGLKDREILIQDCKRFYKLIPFREYSQIKDLNKLLDEYDVRGISNNVYIKQDGVD